MKREKNKSRLVPLANGTMPPPSTERYKLENSHVDGMVNVEISKLQQSVIIECPCCGKIVKISFK